MAGTVDLMRLALAALVVLLGAALYTVLAEQTFALRMLVLLGAIVAGTVLFWTTAAGRTVRSLLHDTQLEVRKVVWPARQTTLQMVAMVMVMVFLVALILWFLDWMLGGLVTWLLG